MNTYLLCLFLFLCFSLPLIISEPSQIYRVSPKLGTTKLYKVFKTISAMLLTY